jgi:hypothetical protein
MTTVAVYVSNQMKKKERERGLMHIIYYVCWVYGEGTGQKGLYAYMHMHRNCDGLLVQNDNEREGMTGTSYAAKGTPRPCVR